MKRLTDSEKDQVIAIFTAESRQGQRWAHPLLHHFLPERGIGYVLYEDNTRPGRRFIVRFKAVRGMQTPWVITSSSETAGIDTLGCPDSLLNLSTMTDPTSLDWRHRCHQSNLRQTRKGVSS